MWRVVHPFADVTDNNHVYKAGDEFPRAGVEVAPDRIVELSGTANKIGVPLIEKVIKRKKRD